MTDAESNITVVLTPKQLDVLMETFWEGVFGPEGEGYCDEAQKEVVKLLEAARGEPNKSYALSEAEMLAYKKALEKKLGEGTA